VKRRKVKEIGADAAAEMTTIFQISSKKMSTTEMEVMKRTEKSMKEATAIAPLLDAL